MEEKAPVKSAMVSRLPKFGGRSTSSGTSPLTNGSPQSTAPSQDGKTTPPGTRSNGTIRASPFSLKWKKDGGVTPSGPTTPTSPVDGSEDKAQILPSLTKEVRNGSPATPKMRRSGPLAVAVSSPKAIPKSLKISPKAGTKLGQSPLNGGCKMSPNGSILSVRTASESRLARPKLSSISPRSSSQDSLSQSNESLKILALDNMVRSNSFTHFKQIPSPSNEPMTRSFSFNRAVELAKPLTNTQLQPPRSSFLKPPQLSNGRVGLGLNGSLGSSGGLSGGLQLSRTPPAVSSVSSSSIPPAPNTPRALKKPLLPNCVLAKSLVGGVGPLGCKLARPGQNKQHKNLFPGGIAKEDARSSAASECGGLLGVATDIETTGGPGRADPYSDSDGSSGDRAGKRGRSGIFKPRSSQAAGETLEDMSLSSASSLDRGDTSEEFLDDFDSVGDVLSDGDLPDNGNRITGSINQLPLENLFKETVDWDSVDLDENQDDSPMQDSQGPLVRDDAPHVSSVELSPSNSSGGTYMWDEEGLEPLGGPGTHPLDSYDDSELNSMDILNNLEPPGSGELDDDDLMLDVDLPEDGLHDVDRMSHLGRSERGSRHGQRRKHHRWSGPDHPHHDGRSHVFQHYDGLKSSRIASRPTPSEGGQHGFAPTLDELTLEHMTQDCSLLKNQLLRLKMLLQLEDTESPADVPEEIDESTTASQVDTLIEEVQLLREELRSRDKTIAQLTIQCQQLQQQHQREQPPAQGRPMRCQCHHQRAPSSMRHGDRQMDKRTHHHYDKATQTYWRPPNHAGVLPTPLLSPWQAQHQGLTRTSMPQRRQTTPNKDKPRILQPFSPRLSEHLHKERLVKTPHIAGPSNLTRSRSEEAAHIDAERPLQALVADTSGTAGPAKLSHPPSSNPHCLDSGAPQGISAREGPASAAQSATQHEQKAQILHNSITPGSAATTCPRTLQPPRMLQPPRLHKRLSLPTLKPGGTGGFASPKPGCFLGPLANQSKQLPPPSRGLPCFNTGPQVQSPSPCRTSLLQPRRISQPCRDPRSHSSASEEPSQGTLKDAGSAKTLNPLSRSCLPKPKIP